MPQDHWLSGFNFGVKDWDAQGLNYETLATRRTLELARAVFKVAVEENQNRAVHDLTTFLCYQQYAPLVVALSSASGKAENNGALKQRSPKPIAHQVNSYSIDPL
jgi:hypothetical protein